MTETSKRYITIPFRHVKSVLIPTLKIYCHAISQSKKGFLKNVYANSKWLCVFGRHRVIIPA